MVLGDFSMKMSLPVPALPLLLEMPVETLSRGADLVTAHSPALTERGAPGAQITAA